MKETGLTGKRRSTTIAATPDDGNSQRKRRRTMDTNLNWKRHSEKICNKCAKMIGILNRLKYVLPHGIKIMLYNSLILPHINYCIMAWGYKGSRLLKIQK